MPIISASVPELVNLITSADGTKFFIAFPQAISSSVEAPGKLPFAIVSLTTLTISGCACPNNIDPCPDL